MPKYDLSHLSRFAEANGAHSPPPFLNKHVVVVGATQGLGRAGAIKYAELGASVVVAGRSETAGVAVVEEMKRVTPAEAAQTAKYHFLKLDVTSLDDVDEFSRKVSSLLPSIDYLHLSPGNSWLGPMRVSVDGYDATIQVQYLGRAQLMLRLAPLIEKANGRILIILGGGFQRKIDFENDLDMVKDHGKMRRAQLPSLLMDSFATGFAERYPRLSVIHLYPGLALDPTPPSLSTLGFPSLLAWPIDCLISVAQKSGHFATTSTMYSNALAYVGWHDDFGKGGLTNVNEDLTVYGPAPDAKDPEAVKKVYDWTVKVAKLDRPL
ncbi:hypothetical protein HK097_001403 [Rhizophlyctis rosea]|uniref:NAD(P)-binding protein n=1 Tax=Rhizophlyctis rosea TaxID=64517 RepID=A0AAD5X0T3_9FUNG|nr:hypothetical protein HK097_001403 [Rhizophlyctis rosea]